LSATISHYFIGGALALYFMLYNFCRIPQTLRVTSTMKAGACRSGLLLDEIIGSS
jgi:hypothetical protein